MRKSTKIIIFIAIVLFILIFAIYKLRIPILKLIYPTEYYEYVEKYSEEYNVDMYLIFATIKAESNFDFNAESSKGAKGLMQIMDTTADDIATSIGLSYENIDILDPETNIMLGTKYISMMIEKYECIELALAAYNAGSGNVDSWIEEGILSSDGSDIENIPYKETNNYVRKILRDYEIYVEIYVTE